ncbi:peptide chain release factor N(5)-glutamine methyltransferase [Actinomycetaceae bacterium TAE3-ERU4]|nr:peptide chain release factor N(5)-glutamine methyltransferase [Actinomycetaceae bacterium TAE3-ERU4]
MRFLISACIARAAADIETAGVPGARACAREIARVVTGIEELALGPREFSASQLSRFNQMVKEVIQGLPLQLVTGRMHLRHLTFKSSPGVFIVRPETEVVIGAAMEALLAKEPFSQVYRIVDLCTGSGAIAACLASELKNLGYKAEVYAVEIDRAAIGLAKENFAALAPNVQLLEGDAREPFTQLKDESFDLVISNPPYIPNSRLLPENVANYDPELALYGGSEDGLAIPLSLVNRAYELLTPGGILVMEHDDTQGKDLVNYSLRQGFVEAATGVDLNGRDRYLLACKKTNMTVSVTSGMR